MSLTVTRRPLPPAGPGPARVQRRDGPGVTLPVPRLPWQSSVTVDSATVTVGAANNCDSGRSDSESSPLMLGRAKINGTRARLTFFWHLPEMWWAPQRFVEVHDILLR